jgi:putative membrane protein
MDFVPFGGLWFLVALLMQVAVLVLVVLGIIWLIRRLGLDRAGPSNGRARSAVDELELRYARGEVDRSTYLQMRDDLTKGASE